MKTVNSNNKNRKKKEKTNKKTSQDNIYWQTTIKVLRVVEFLLSGAKNEKMNGDNRSEVKTYNNTSTEHSTTVTNIFCDMTNEFWMAEIFEVKLHDHKIYNDIKLKWWHYWLQQTKSLKMLFGGRDQQS